MLTYLLRRLLGALLVVFCVFTLSFVIMRTSPGSPFDQDKELAPQVVASQAVTTGMAAPVPLQHGGVLVEVLVEKNQQVRAGQPYATLIHNGERIPAIAETDFEVFRVVRHRAERVAQGRPLLYKKTGLLTQYLTTLWSYSRLDFGATFDSSGQRTVMQNLRETLPVSMELGLYALLIALLIGVSAGLLAGLRQNTWIDHSVMSVTMLGISVPSIVLGPLLILVFVMKLGWLPPYGGWELGFGHFGTKILPALTLGLGYAAVFARLTRGGMLEVVQQDWIRTARAKGVPEHLVVLRHAFRGAILPTVTYLGPAIASLMVGSVVVERVFQVPGVSKYFVDSAINRDYPMVMGVVVVYSVLLVTLNLLVDMAYAYLDPRVTYE